MNSKPERSEDFGLSPAIDIHVGSRLRLRRVLLEMSHQELSEYISIPVSTLIAYETGAAHVSAATLYYLCQKMEVPMTWFFDGLSIERRLPLDPQCRSAESIGRELVEVLSAQERAELLSFYFEGLSADLQATVLDVARTLARQSPSLPGNWHETPS